MLKWIKRKAILTFLFVWSQSSISQNIYDTALVDTVSLKYKKGFDIQDFIKMTKADTSFYRAFKNLRMYPHISENKIETFGGGR